MISFSICGSTRLTCCFPPSLFDGITPEDEKSFKKNYHEAKDIAAAGVFRVMKPCCKPCRMCEFRVSTGSLAALAVLLCVLSLGAPARALQHDFIELPQTFAQICDSVRACVPPADKAGRVRPNTVDRAVAGLVPGGLRAKRKSGDSPREYYGHARVPVLAGAQDPDLLTTWSGAGDQVAAAPAAVGGPSITASTKGELETVVAPAAAAPYLASDRVASMALADQAPGLAPVPAARPAAVSNAASGVGSLDRLAAGASGTSGSATKPDAQGGAQSDDAATTPENADGGKEGTGEKGSGDFSGSASPAGPDLNATEEQSLILNGWK